MKKADKPKREKRTMAHEYGPGAMAAVVPRKGKGRVMLKPRGPRS